MNRIFYLLFAALPACLSCAQKPAVKQAETNQVTDSSYLYFAFLDVTQATADTVYLEKDIYLFIDRQDDNALKFMKNDQGPFIIPPSHYNQISEFIFDNFLADDKYKILKRMSEMNGLLENAKIGIDISKHQSASKNIDWKQVQDDTLYANVEFVIIRSTLGYSVSFDSKLASYYQGAKDAGLPVGLYHNFVMNIQKRPDYLEHTREQARKFVAAFKDRQIDFKPILDLEDHKEYAVNDQQFTSEQICEATREFIKIVKEELNTDVIIYSYEGFYNKHLKGYFDDYHVWIAKYPHTPDFATRNIFPGSKHPFLGISYDFKNQKFNYTLKNKSIGWQYSQYGIVNGIASDVDMNIILDSDYNKWLR